MMLKSDKNEVCSFELIHEADLQSRPVVITILHVLSVRPYVRPTLQNLAKQDKVQAGIVIATGGTAWVWPSGSLMALISCLLFDCHEWNMPKCC